MQNKKVFLLLIILTLVGCAAATGPVKTEIPKSSKVVAGPVPGEIILDETGEEVTIRESDPEFFQKPSTDTKEFYRVIIKSDLYTVRQIRGTKSMTRKPDTGGDKLISEELKKYDMINFADEGVIQVKISSKHGTIEALKFLNRAPRINNLAKIMQNDATRWNIQFEDEDQKILEFNIYYQVELQNFSNREEVKEKLKKEVVR